MLLTQTSALNFVLKLPLGHALRWEYGSKYITDPLVYIEIYTDFYISISIGGH